MKLYVAGKWSDKDEIGKKIQEFRELGHTITHDWTQIETSLNQDPEALKKYSSLDIEAVRECEMLIAWMTDPKYAYRGTYTEIGCALGLKKKVVIISEHTKYNPEVYYTTNIFFHHPDIKHGVGTRFVHF